MRWHHLDGNINLELLRTAEVLQDNGLGTTIAQLDDERLAVERLVSNRSIKGGIVDQRWHLNAVAALAWYRWKADQIATGICQRQDPGPHAAF